MINPLMKIRYAMIGGGEGAFIGETHRQAALLDNDYLLVSGVFSQDAEKSLRTGLSLGLSPSRCYANYSTLFAKESNLAEDQKIQCVVIVTPNHLHFPIASEALKFGFHVLSDKPATINLAECQHLAKLINDSGLLYGLTHPYIAYPIICEARERVANGQLGQIRKVIVEYTQGWLSEQIENQGNQQASWRLDPKKGGISCCMADIGVHAFNLTEYITGLKVSMLSADLNSILPGRVLDDDGSVLLKFDNGAKGLLFASQICLGDENNLRIRIYGDKASLDWSQMEANSLWFKYADKPSELFRTGSQYLGPEANTNTRLPAGHPEGYIEAFANIYRHFAQEIREFNNQQHQKKPNETSSLVTKIAGIEEALRGMSFIETVVESSKAENKWIALKSYYS